MQVSKTNTGGVSLVHRLVLSFVLGFSLFAFGSIDVLGQCSTSTPLDIPDGGLTTIQFIVSGLTNSDLSSPGQGICGVNLEFVHEYLGDITVTLVSPSGTSVELIGPITTAIPPTNLSQWDVRFIPCMDPAMPDAGFADTWSNLQPWTAFTPYNGIYHPHQGCLEDFNTGSANGVWQIIINDNDVLQTGTLFNDLLIFCDPTGLQCAQCNPKGGSLSPVSVTKCVGQNFASAELTVDFGGNPPSPSSYSYEYVMTSGNSIIRYGSSFSDFPLPGTYTICGLSYLTIDSMLVNDLFESGDYNQLNQAVTSGDICGEFSSPCVILTVLDIPDTVAISANVCNGESFSFGGQSYNTMGTYFQTRNGPGLCDSVFRIQIFTSDLDFNIQLPDTLNCGVGNVIITSSVTGNNGPVIYSWSTLTGSIIGATDGPSITVDQPGQYFLSVSDAVCSKVKIATVPSDQGFPQVFVEGGTITCNNPSVTLNPIFIPTTSAVLWNGPLGFVSSQPNVNVSVPGNYLITVTNPAGCSVSRTVVVNIDTTTHSFNIISLGKNCQNQTIVLAGDNDASVALWNWTGPNGFSDTYWRPEVHDPGTYTLTLTFTNGCLKSQNYVFDGDFTLPDISVSPEDTLNCNEVITLSVSSNTPGVAYGWSGPIGFSSNLPDIQISQAGTYTASVSAPNGCRNFQDVPVVTGPDIFAFQAFTDTLNCSEDVVVVGIISPDADLFKWIGFTGPDSLSPFINVSTPGTYTVMLTDTNAHCSLTTTLIVYSDFTPPSFSYTTDTISCNDPIAQLSFVPSGGTVYTNIFWELPDQSIVPGPTLNSSQTGEHKLVAIGKNGCSAQIPFFIPLDTISPSLFIESNTLGCEDTVMITTFSVEPLVNYQWSGPGIVTPGIEQIAVNRPGFYDLIVTAENGCTTDYSILVDSNFVPPPYTLILDSLRCDVSATLEVASTDSLAIFRWLNLSGGVISPDSFVQVNMPGMYVVEVTGGNNCFLLDTVTIDPLLYPSFIFETDTLTCVTLSASIKAISATQPVTYQWTDITGNPLGVTDEISVTDADPYVLTVTGQNACETKDTISVPIDTVPPTSNILLVGELRCQNRDVMFDGSTSVPADVQYDWNTIGGNIIGSNTLSLIDARDTGIYVLTIVRNDNGCTDVDSFHLTEHPDAILLANLGIDPPQCSGDSNATIQVLSLQGGVQPLLFRLDGGVIQSNPTFADLKPGDHLLQVIDSAGCIYDTLVTIIPTNPFTVDAGPDQEIYLGETIMLSGTTDLVPGEIFSQQWDSLGVVFCTDCPDFEVGPHLTTTYRYQVVSVTGCVLEDDVIIYVIEKAKYYIPNVFTPDGDGINEEIRLYATPGIVRVRKWIIFDRWGNAVFGREDFDPADPSVFWDGYTPRGERLNPAVFPYILEVDLLNGKTEIYNGDITLIR